MLVEYIIVVHSKLYTNCQTDTQTSLRYNKPVLQYHNVNKNNLYISKLMSVR